MAWDDKGDDKRDDEVFFCDFEDVNNQSFNSSSNSLLNLVNFDSKNSIDNICNNNALIKKNLYSNEEIKEYSKVDEKKYMQYFKFPCGELPKEIV